MSREYRGSRVVIYPSYLDSSLSRRKGRRVPLELAISNPTLDEIVQVCERLGLHPEVERGKYYPRSSRREERVIVDKRGSKLETLRIIAKTLKELRLRKS